MKEANLLLDPPASGTWNMAVDQALLASTDQNQVPTLRIYRWSQPTLSLGYFQSHKERELHQPSQRCPWVRRTSGGGAIVHDIEITYSLCVPKSEPWFKNNTGLYDVVHDATIEALSDYGVLARKFDSTTDTPAKDPKAFLCFQRRTSGDVVLDDFKIGGSAQRRSKRSLLQHGSLLITRSDAAPELPGITELSKVHLNASIFEQEFVDNWCNKLKNRLSWNWVPENLSEVVAQAAKEVEETRFLTLNWNQKR